MLQSDPEKELKSYIFMIEHAAQGSESGIRNEAIVGSAHKSMPDVSGNGHYFFHQGRLDQAPGTVAVPVGQRREHDGDCLQLTGPVRGAAVCRFGPDDCDQFHCGDSVSVMVDNGGKNSGYFQFAMITVHHAGKSKMLSNCINTETDNRSGKLARAHTITTAPADWMTNFDDAR